MIRIPFDNTYVQLPERFYTRTSPTAVRRPRLIRINQALAADLGIELGTDQEELARVFSGNLIPEGAEPIAMAYSGHQFGSFVPQLGDGRAILLGEVIDASGVRRDVQLKGAGRTPWSRGGDGRAALGPVLREYVVSESMHALGIRTTRSLAAVLTGERVIREEPLPGAVLTRVAASHIRVGTFEYFAARQDVEAVKLLADYVIARHYRAARESERPYLSLLESVVEAQAELIASWLLIGLIHGVMNTDNMTVSGETIDYGPCAFLDEYHPNKVFSSIDRYGRYAFANQPAIGGWNLARLAECLLPLLSDDLDAAVAQANEVLANYEPAFEKVYHAGLRKKLGLRTAHADDVDLASGFLALMSANKADFTLAFRRLSDAAGGDESGLRDVIGDSAALDEWLERWRRRLEDEPQSGAQRQLSMRAVNPMFIPRNHHVEAMIRAAVEDDDFRPFEKLLMVLSRPFDDQPEFSEYAEAPQESERVLQTFCGT